MIMYVKPICQLALLVLIVSLPYRRYRSCLTRASLA